MESLNDAQSAEGAPFSASPFSSDAHPSRKRHWKEIESSDNNDVVNIHSNTAREAKIQARSHIFPTETQKIALFELKDLPDQAIFTWLAMARSGSVGPINGPTVRKISNSLLPGLPHTMNPMLGDVLSGTSLESLEDPGTNQPGLNIVSSGDLMQQPLPAQEFPFYSDCLAPEMLKSSRSGNTYFTRDNTRPLPRELSSLPSTQAASSFGTNSGPSTALDDNQPSNKISTEASQCRLSCPRKSSPKDRMRWPCTICEQTFSGRREWMRHEQNQHFPPNLWICQPDIILLNKKLYCIVCSTKNPECSHVAKHEAYACAKRDTSVRRFTSREKFIKHLSTHELSSDCLQIEEWEQPRPKQIWGCGFCIKVFDDIDERLFHIEKHYKRGHLKANWNHSRVVLGLLTLPFIANDWILLLNLELNVECYGQEWPEMSWSKEEAIDLQQRLTTGQESGAELAKRAFEASDVGKELYQRHKSNQQVGFAFPSLPAEPANPTEYTSILR